LSVGRKVDQNGRAVFLIDLPLGHNSLTASYSGDASFLASISEALDLTI
jgi:hypothetical protein